MRFYFDDIKFTPQTASDLFQHAAPKRVRSISQVDTPKTEPTTPSTKFTHVLTLPHVCACNHHSRLRKSVPNWPIDILLLLRLFQRGFCCGVREARDSPSYNPLKPLNLHPKPQLNLASSLNISRPKQSTSPGRAANGDVVCTLGVGDGCGDPLQNDVDGKIRLHNSKPKPCRFFDASIRTPNVELRCWTKWCQCYCGPSWRVWCRRQFEENLAGKWGMLSR